MRLSIVDLGTVAPGQSESDALADALETAKHAERHGFHRIWFAEHHLTTSGASHHPELMIARVEPGRRAGDRIHVRRVHQPTGRRDGDAELSRRLPAAGVRARRAAIDEVRATLEQMLEESQADEMMIQDLVATGEVRRRSHELLAEMFDLPR